MAKKKTVEKLRLRIVPETIKNPLPKNPGVKKILTPWFILILIILFFIFTIFPITKQIQITTNQKEILPRSFGFALQTSKWIGESLQVEHGNIHFNIDNLADLKTTKDLDLSKYRKGFNNKISLNEAIFKQFGTTNPWQAYKKNGSLRTFDFNETWLYNILSGEIASKVNQLNKNAILEIQDDRAIQFRPHVIGQSLNVVETVSVIKIAAFSNQNTTGLKIVITKPLIVLSDLNSLGIEEIVAQGESDFSGSSASRITNIRVGASRYNGLILKPNQEFSFNEHLGSITAATGFKPELVIKSTGTVPELGGGLCQVSTTVFRAALYGGLPITARKNHSYAVNYYSPQGTDATIYPGVVDFKFINDTPNHLLINSYLEGTKLHFDFYGTKDSRKTEIDGPYQYDFGTGGSIRARLTRTIKYDQKEVVDNFYSRYVSKNLFPKIYEYPGDPKNDDLQNGSPIKELIDELLEPDNQEEILE